MLKFGFNLIDDGLVGQQVYAGEATRLAYGTEEAKRGAMRSSSARATFHASPSFPDSTGVSIRFMRDVAPDGSFLCHDKAMLGVRISVARSGVAIAQTEEKPFGVTLTLEVATEAAHQPGLTKYLISVKLSEEIGSFGVRHGCASAHGSRAQRRLQQPVQRELVGIKDEPKFFEIVPDMADDTYATIGLSTAPR